MLVGALVLGLLLSLAGLSPVSAGPEREEADPRPLRADFDGDGFGDLAIGVPGEYLEGADDAGGVNVLYGRSYGLSTEFDQFWAQDNPGLSSEAEAGDEFGRALAAGDFDGDGHTDLAVGVPYEDEGDLPMINAGLVNVIYGSGGGLYAAERWLQPTYGLLDTAEAGDGFGYALAAGDFDRDGYDDLAIGVPYEGLYGGFEYIGNAGAVNVLYGSSGGLTAEDDQYFDQETEGIEGNADTDELFGYALTAGDLNGDGYDDLAIGVPGDGDAGVNDAGAVNVLYGGPDGLTADNRIWRQGAAGVPDSTSTSDRFGDALAAGDLNGDGYDDLIVGIPLEDTFVPFVYTLDTGAVQVLYGSSDGLTATGNQFWDQSRLEFYEQGDRFGFALVTGDFDGDNYADLAIGVPFEDLVSGGAFTDAGVVHVLRGSSAGLTETERQLWHQDQPEVEDQVEGREGFGYALAAADFDADGYADLAIGVPYEELEGATTITNAGVVHVIFGSSGGLAAGTRDQWWHQDVYEVNESAEEEDRFGFALAALVPEGHRTYLPAVLRNF